MKKNLTIIIPTYNRIFYLKKSLMNLIKNKRKDIIFLIINNYSNDGTLKFLTKVKKKDSRIIIVNNKKNFGATYSTLLGFSLVETPYCMWLSDDDTLKGDYISRCLSLIKQYPELGVIHCDYQNFKKRKFNFKVFKKGSGAINAIYMRSGAFSGFFFKTSLIKIPNQYYRNKIYFQIDMSLKLAKISDICILQNYGIVPIKRFFDGNDEKILFNLVNQGRDQSYGINERASYAFQNLGKFDKFSCYLSLAIWTIKITQSYPNSLYQQFVKSISSYNDKDFLFVLFLMFFKRPNLLILRKILKNLTSIDGIVSIFNQLIYLPIVVIIKFMKYIK